MFATLWLRSPIVQKRVYFLLAARYDGKLVIWSGSTLVYSINSFKFANFAISTLVLSLLPRFATTTIIGLMFANASLAWIKMFLMPSSYAHMCAGKIICNSPWSLNLCLVSMKWLASLIIVNVMVRWKGFSSADDTWEPVAHLSRTPALRQLLQNYEQRRTRQDASAASRGQRRRRAPLN